MAARMTAWVFSRWGGRSIGGVMVAALWIMGEAHMARLGFSWAAFNDSFREYALLCAAGALFGWLLKDSASAFARDFFTLPSRTLFPWPPGGWIVASLLFVSVLHQFRYFLNDGPANMAMGAGLLANMLYSEAAIFERGAARGPEAEGDPAFAALAERFGQNPYSAELFGKIAAAHHRAGNRFKCDVAREMVSLLEE